MALWLAAKELPWKWIGIGLAALAIFATIAFGYMHVEGLKDDLVETRAKLATEQRRSAEAIARADGIKVEHEKQTARLQALESQRSAIAVEVLQLRKTIDEIDLQQDLEGDDETKADAAIDRLNARNRELTRLLEQTSGAGELRPRKDPGSEASQAGTPSAFQRALQALRKDGVSHVR